MLSLVSEAFLKLVSFKEMSQERIDLILTRESI